MYTMIVLLPLAAALLAGFGGRWIGERGSQWVTCGAVSISAALSLVAFSQIALGGTTAHIHLLSWIDSGGFKADWALKIDTLTAVMLVVVNGVSALVHIYSVGYMSHDPHKPRFMAYLSFFTFAMLMLVTADNFVQLFFGWEGVGLASYLLIGFWYKKPSANAAAIKAFVVNRVGDFGFALGIFAIYLVFGALDFETVFATAPEFVGKTFEFVGYQFDILTTITALLFIGAMGKSAQLGLHTWLPDAMEGPTPVSALIHAATMVTAGVFMVARCSPLFELAPATLAFVAFIGASTAIFAATIALVQNDIKRVIAYSTCSQLGYMFFAIGVSAYGAAIFHLFTHAFFKALLFLGSGAVIHAMSDEQDMRKMGGLRKHLPMTHALMWIGSLALAGVPLFAGYYSKDMILESAYASTIPMSEYAFVMGIAAAFLTAFYSGRLLFMTFYGAPRASDEVMSHVHEAPKVMLIPLILLAIGAIFSGMLFADDFIGHHYEAFWGDALFLAGANIIEAAHHVPLWVKWLPVGMGLTGFALSWYFYIRRPDLPVAIAKMHSPIYQFLLNKWYFDELYDLVLIRPAKWVGAQFWRIGDGRIIDGFGPDGISATVAWVATRMRRLQTGYLYHYAFAMLIGVAVIITWFTVR